MQYKIIILDMADEKTAMLLLLLLRGGEEVDNRNGRFREDGGYCVILARAFFLFVYISWHLTRWMVCNTSSQLIFSIASQEEEKKACLPAEETAIVDPAAAAAEGITTLYLCVTEFLFLLTMS